MKENLPPITASLNLTLGATTCSATASIQEAAIKAVEQSSQIPDEVKKNAIIFITSNFTWLTERLYELGNLKDKVPIEIQEYWTEIAELIQIAIQAFKL